VRKRSFDEVELGYSEEMAMEEAKRCLRCDWEMQKLRRQREAESRATADKANAERQPAGSA